MNRLRSLGLTATAGLGLVLAGSLAASLVGCGTVEPAAAPRVSQAHAALRLDAIDGRYAAPSNAGAATYLAILQSRQAITSAVWHERTLADLLPDQLFSIAGAAPAPRSAGVVIGTVTAVEPGAGFTVPRQEDGVSDAASGTLAAFDDPDAVWRTAVVTVTADHFLTRSHGAVRDEVGRTVQVSVTIDADADARTQLEGIKALGDVVVVLDPSRTERSRSGVPGVAWSGSLFGDVDAHGVLGFPALGEGNAAFVDGVDTVAELLDRARTRPPVIDSAIIDGVLKRG